MGLTVYYDWKTKTDLPSARRMIAKLRAIALKLPFDEVSEIREQDPLDGKSAFRQYDHSFRQGGLYLSRTAWDFLSQVTLIAQSLLPCVTEVKSVEKNGYRHSVLPSQSPFF
jgi:hypothetical protein